MQRLKAIFCLEETYSNTYLPALYYQERYPSAKFYSEGRRLVGENYCDYLEFQQPLGNSAVSRYWINGDKSEALYLMPETKTVLARWKVERSLSQELPPNSELKVVTKVNGLENHLLYDVYGNNVIIPLPIGTTLQTEGCFVIPSYFSIIQFYTNIPNAAITFTLELEDFETSCFDFTPYESKKYCFVKNGQRIPCFEIRPHPVIQGSFQKVVFPPFRKYAASVRAEFLSNIYVECLQVPPATQSGGLMLDETLNALPDVRNLTKTEILAVVNQGELALRIFAAITMELVFSIAMFVDGNPQVQLLNAQFVEENYGPGNSNSVRQQSGVIIFSTSQDSISYPNSIEENLYVDFWYKDPPSILVSYDPDTRCFKLDKGVYEIEFDFKVNFLRRSSYDPEDPKKGKYELGPLYNPSKPVMFAMVFWSSMNRKKLDNDYASTNPAPVPGLETKTCTYLKKKQESSFDFEAKATWKISHDGSNSWFAFSILDGGCLLTNGEPGFIGSTFNMNAKDFTVDNNNEFSWVEPSSFSLKMRKLAEG